jgi:hypothetical protein
LKPKKLPQKIANCYQLLLPDFDFPLAFKHESFTLCEENGYGALHGAASAVNLFLASCRKTYFDQICRDDMLDFLHDLQTRPSRETGNPIGESTVLNYFLKTMVFLNLQGIGKYVAREEWVQKKDCLSVAAFVNGRHFRSHGAQVRGQLSSMMDAVVVEKSKIGDRRKIEDTEKLDWRAQLIWRHGTHSVGRWFENFCRTSQRVRRCSSVCSQAYPF